MLYPSSIPPKSIIERADAIWRNRGIKPKQHLSEQRPGAVTIMERRAHADRCENLPLDLPDDMGNLFTSLNCLAVNYLSFVRSHDRSIFSPFVTVSWHPDQLCRLRTKNKLSCIFIECITFNQ